ncbi:MAG: hypothetical protein QMD85_00240, partial [Candidatus Aenigmarchaeota archaeon]|nr:hypothetical protein [Candidatus Aenigmarchaeota archaeon]MDI6721956.1 hypothetical protein [Candidatus Aenigmarchaeota archaeon]
ALAVRTMESVLKDLTERLDSFGQKVKYMEENDERVFIELKILSDRLEIYEKVQDRMEIDEAIKKIKRG